MKYGYAYFIGIVKEWCIFVNDIYEINGGIIYLSGLFMYDAISNNGFMLEIFARENSDELFVISDTRICFKCYFRLEW